MARTIGFIMIVIGFGFLFLSALTAARDSIEHAKYVHKVKLTCAMAEHAPIIRMDTRKQVEAYLYACQDN